MNQGQFLSIYRELQEIKELLKRLAEAQAPQMMRDEAEDKIKRPTNSYPLGSITPDGKKVTAKR